MNLNRRRLLCSLAATGLLGGSARAGDGPDGGVAVPPPPFRDRLLPNEAERVRLTKEYLEAHLPIGREGSVDPTAMAPRAIALHWTGGASADSAWSTFAPARLAGRRELQDAGALNVGAHFLVDRDGSAWRLVPPTRVMRHVIGMNHCTVGIENVGDGPLGGGSSAALTVAQVDANISLIGFLKGLFPSIGLLFGHHEYRVLESHTLFAERDPHYRTAKIDPGASFMARVRAGVVPLALAAP